MRRLFILICLFHVCFIASLNAQDDSYEYYDSDYKGIKNYVYKNNIHTVKIFQNNIQLTYPIIELNGQSKITLCFDDFDDNIKNYSYQIIHCDADWKKTDIIDTEYNDGFSEADITNYEYSFNTNLSYTHYWLQIPNERIKPKISGNYILKVYEDYDNENVVLTQRFCVVEPKIRIEAKVHRATWTNQKLGGQEVDFVIKNPSYPIMSPDNELKVIISQNNRWDKAIYDLKPRFISPGVIDYNYEKENVFEGGNEFRYFDAKNIKFQSIRVKNIYFERPYYHFQLWADMMRTRKIFSYHEDLNGRCFVQRDHSQNSMTEADYIMVDFILPYPEPIVTGEVYVTGELSNWHFSEKNKMTYNLAKRAYEKSLLVKQGYYNYMYTLLNKSTKKADDTFFEGSHHQTENDYVIYVYHCDIRNRYDKLIGVEIVNSIKKI